MTGVVAGRSATPPSPSAAPPTTRRRHVAEVYLYSRARAAMGGPSPVQRNFPRRHRGSCSCPPLTNYDVPAESRSRPTARPDHPSQPAGRTMNATNHVLHQGLAELFPQLDAALEPAWPCFTGNGGLSRPAVTSSTIDELARDEDLRKLSLTTGARSSPAWSLPCAGDLRGQRRRRLGSDLVALSQQSSTWPRAPTCRPAVLIRPRRGGRGPVTWPLRPACSGQGVRPPGTASGAERRADRLGQPRRLPTTRSSTRPWRRG